MASESMDPTRRPGNNADDGTTATGQSAEESIADNDAVMNAGVHESDVNMGFIGSLEPVESDRDSISEMLLAQLGSCGRSYRREAQKACRKIISEMYPAPRVSAELKKMATNTRSQASRWT